MSETWSVQLLVLWGEIWVPRALVDCLWVIVVSAVQLWVARLHEIVEGCIVFIWGVVISVNYIIVVVIGLERDWFRVEMAKPLRSLWSVEVVLRFPCGKCGSSHQWLWAETEILLEKFLSWLLLLLEFWELFLSHWLVVAIVLAPDW